MITRWRRPDLTMHWIILATLDLTLCKYIGSFHYLVALESLHRMMTSVVENR